MFLRNLAALERFWPRLCSKAQQRDEALNEIRVAYFLHFAGYPIVAWEPTDAQGYNLEYAVAIPRHGDMLVEVKSPGWEAELTEVERMAGRAKEPKYRPNINEGGAAGPVEVIRRTVEKARPKFSGNRPSLVVISDDCRVNLGKWGWGPLQMALRQGSIAYGPGLFQDAKYSAIGAVCLFWSVASLGRRGAEYDSLCIPNPHAMPTAIVPHEVVSGLTTKLKEPQPLKQKLHPNCA